MFTQKVLCIGNNTEDTDLRTTELAVKLGTINHGLIDQVNYVPEEYGCYHTSLTDLSAGHVISLSKYFDSFYLLDQPVSEWSHQKILSASFNLLKDLETQGKSTFFRTNNNVKHLIEFDVFLKENKSFCIYPWIVVTENNGVLTPCARAAHRVTTRDKLQDWSTDPSYTKIRNNMLAGIKDESMCSVCYKYEDLGIESYREFETKEWISKLNISSIDDLHNIKHPYYYELRLDNTCNLACRGCRPSHSSRINTEYKKHNIVFEGNQSWEYSSVDIIDYNTLTPLSRVYLTGGEPLVMTKVYKFMEDCIAAGKTDFEFTLGTNAAHVSKKFLALAKHFSNLIFSISVDGYDKVNDYWRWGSIWSEVVANTKLLQTVSKSISFNCVPGIYNVTNLHKLFQFIDQEFPMSNLYLQLNYFSSNSAFNHPDIESALFSLSECKKTNIYYTNGKSVKSTVDQLFTHYSNNPTVDYNELKKFFEFNDRLDHIRGIKLADYIPELDACRQFIQNS